MNRQKLDYDIVVIGGGYAGSCAAIAAARELRRMGLTEATVVLVQERPVLGGCASSEIRVPPIGAGRHPWGYETGIIHEYMLEERKRNHVRWEYGSANSICDLIWWEMMNDEPNLTMLLNTTVRDVVMGGHGADGRPQIAAVLASQLGTEKEFEIGGRYFIDATGDGTVGFRAGADYRMGREGRAEFGESFAPEVPDNKCMGSTLLFQARDIGYPAPFEPPAYAPVFPDEASLCGRPMSDFKSGYWWIEIGYPFHTLDENEDIRDELVKHVLGVWDHLKNRNPRFRDLAQNWVLDWFGWMPGKRESRRIVGDHLLTENDIRQSVLFPDRIAYGGHFLDLHTMGGILAKGQPGNPVDINPELWDQMRVSPYSIPLRSLYSATVANLLLAGRDLSATHVAMGSTRVMLTNAVIGQGVGTAAAYCVQTGLTPRGVADTHIGSVQQSLLRQGCYLPQLASNDERDLSRRATASCSSEAPFAVVPGPRVGDDGAEGPTAESAVAAQAAAGADGRAAAAPGVGRRSLEQQLGAVFPMTGDALRTVWLWLESDAAEPVELTIGLQAVAHIWDVNRPAARLAEAGAVIPPGSRGWVPFHFAQRLSGEHMYWVHTLAPSEPKLYWRYELDMPTGSLSVWKRSTSGKWLYASEGYRKGFQALCLKTDPVSYPYGAANVLSGVTRPEERTHCWVSDPQAAQPQWLRLTWPQPVRLNRVELTFDTHLCESNEQSLPMRAQPRCVRDYALECLNGDGEWTTLVGVAGNYQRRRVHDIGDVETAALRVTVLATNGDASARIYEIRAYGPEGELVEGA